MHFVLVHHVCVVATGLSRSIEHQSFIAGPVSPGQQAASEGGQVDLWVSPYALVSGGYIDQWGHGKMTDRQWLTIGGSARWG